MLLILLNNEVDMSTQAVSAPPAVPGGQPPNAVGADIVLQFQAASPAHSRGCPMLLMGTSNNMRLGNPGPQPGFNVREARYSGVVRFFAEVKR